MDSCDIEKEIKIAEETLNKDTTRLMEKCLKEITSTGSPSLDAAVMKQFKRFCRESDDYVRYAFLLIMRYLNKKHSEIRLSAFQVADELFNRSHAFREVLITHLQAFLALTTETEAQRPLPPPKSAANRLKIDTLHALQLWYDKYGQGYKKLAVGYNYLKNCKHVDFNDIRAQNQAERQRLEDEEQRKQRIMASRLAKVLKDISDLKPEIDNCVKEAESCLQLLLPTPTDFMLHLPEDVSNGKTKHPERSVNEVYEQYQNSQELKQPRQNSQELHSRHQKKLADEKEDVSHNESTGAHQAVNTPFQIDQKAYILSPDSCSNNMAGVGSPGLLNKSDNKQLTGTSKSIYHVSSCSKESSMCQLTNSTTSNSQCVSDRSDDSSTSNSGCVSDRSDDTTLKTSHEDIMLKTSHENITLEITSDKNAFNEAASKSRTKESENSSDTEDTTDDNVTEMSDKEDDLNAHGLLTPFFSFVIELPAPGPVSVQVTTDNTDVVSSLKDASKLIINHYLPKVIKWLEILGKNGAKEVDIKAAIDLKVNLENIKLKCMDLKLVAMEQGKLPEEDISDDEEFEDVPEKEGYEPHIPIHMRAEYGLDGTPATVKTVSKPSSVERCDLKVEATNQPSSSRHWSLVDRIKSENISDPTSLASALARIRPDSSTFGVRNSSASSSTQQRSPEKQSSMDVPVVQFGTDLAYWENPDKMEAPSVVKLDSLHRFWAPPENEVEKPSQCPFHGKIIPRDKEGKPNGEDQPSSSQEAVIKSENIDVKDKELPPWLDPELQRDIEQATGHDLGSARSQKLLDKKTKGKGKGKGKKKSKLTDTEAAKNTPRKRLENKIFSKRSMKRVCSTLDNADFKRVRDKFANQFNYSLD